MENDLIRQPFGLPPAPEGEGFGKGSFSVSFEYSMNIYSVLT